MNSSNDTFEYLTDDRDLPHQAKSIVFIGGNGDYYQQISWVDEISGLNKTSPAVRFCTSGGASSKNPKLLSAVSAQYHALAGTKSGHDSTKETLNEALSLLRKIVDGEIKDRQVVEDFLFLNQL
tara:strand:+ start:6672 stop:7043 length:372 start_codon:yes stop_codon:yes gene_type:complete